MSGPIEQLFAGLSARQLAKLKRGEEPIVAHGSPVRLPRFLRPPKGALASFESAQRWMLRFEVAGRLDNKFVQRAARGSALEYYERGQTIRLTSLEERLPAAEQWLRRIASDLDIPSMNGQDRSLHLHGWASKSTRGMPFHYDPQDVILVQLVGTKHVRLAKNRHTRFPDLPYHPEGPPIYEHFALFPQGFPHIPRKAHHQITLHPGSVLYIPRGMWHSTKAISSESFAVAVAINGPSTLSALLEHIGRLLRTDAEWRRPLRGNRRDEAARVSQMLEQAWRAIPLIRATDLIRDPKPPVPKAICPGSSSLQVSPAAQLRLKCRGRRLAVFVSSTVILGKTRQDSMQIVKASFEVAREFESLLYWISNRRALFLANELCARFPALSPEAINGVVEALVRTTYLVQVDVIRY